MMLNSVCLMGRLGADPELRNTPSGIPVTTFRLAVDRTYQAKGQEKQADWVDIVAWRQTAEFVTRYFRKGSLMAVQGYLQTRRYADREGNNRTAVEVVAEHVFFASSKAESSAPSGGPPAGGTPAAGTPAGSNSRLDAGEIQTLEARAPSGEADVPYTTAAGPRAYEGGSYPDSMRDALPAGLVGDDELPF